MQSMICKRTILRTHLVGRMVVCAIVLCAYSFAFGAGNRGRVKPWLVKDVFFTGNASISSSDLLSKMETKKSRLFHTVKFSQFVVNADIEAIVYLYRDKGFLAVEAKTGNVIRDQLSHRVTVNIEIHEGPQTHIGNILLVGNITVGNADILRIIQAKPYAPYSVFLLLSDMQTLRDSIVARGYPLCTVNRIDSVDSIAHSAGVSFIIDQGPLALAGPITIDGAKKLKKRIVKQGVTFHQGDTLTGAQMQMSLRALYETGMVKYVQISAPIADSAMLRKMRGPISLPVHVAIEEADFYKVQGGVGYGTYEGVRLSLQTSYGNVLDMGRTVGLDGKYSKLIQSLHLNYTVPWFFFLPPTAEVDVFGEHHNEVTFVGYLEGLTLSLFAKTRWNFGYRVYTTIELVSGTAIQPLQPLAVQIIPSNNTQSFGTGFTYDLRDNIFDAEKGFFATSDAELAGLIGSNTNHFYRLILDARGYFPVGHIFDAATAVTAGYINGYGVDKMVVPPQEMLYAGSEKIRPVRGYAPGEIGDSVGGRLVLVLNVLECRFAIVKWLKIAGFVDAGYVWKSQSLFSLRDLLFTAGPGIRIRTPIGLLSTDLGVRINGPTKDKIGFTINIGEPF